MDVLSQIDLTQVTMGVLTAAVTILGWRQTKAAQQDTRNQQVAANKLAADQLQLEEYRSLVPDLRTEADRAYQQRDEARVEADRERTLRIELETSMRLAQHQHDTQMRRLTSDLQGLRMIVQDEIAKAASDEAWGPPEPE